MDPTSGNGVGDGVGARVVDAGRGPDCAVGAGRCHRRRARGLPATLERQHNGHKPRPPSFALGVDCGTAEPSCEVNPTDQEKRMDKISTCLWFDGQAEAAAKFYTGIFGNSRIVQVMRSNDAVPGGKPGAALVVDFVLEGRSFQGLNGGPEFKFSPAISLSVSVSTQDELDTLWDKLLVGGGEPSQCGWLTDKFGLSWQIVPKQLVEMMGSPDRAKATAMTKAMLSMSKLDIAMLTKAFDAA
jgi:predicted 3-demethylubiquinone-9 3-methyltransferase (glyoxalase superfamily)